MKKLFLILLLFVFICATTTVLAQDINNRDVQQQRKWTIELSFGARTEIFESNNHEFGYPMTFRPYFPQIEASFWYGIKDYFFLESGLSYVEYNTNWQCGYEIGYPKWKMAFIQKHKLYSALQIPLRARFSVSIYKSNFHFFSAIGLIFQIPLQTSTGNGWFPENDPAKDFYGEFKSENTYYKLIAFSPICGINFLLNTKIGFRYQFGFGLGISFFGEYYKGTRTMVLINATFSDKPFNDYGYNFERTSNYKTKGDSWNAGIGISYSFKNANKKREKNK